MLNTVVLQGRLTADPELRQTPQGISVTQFTIACDRSYAKAGADRQTDFIDIDVWRTTAEFVCKYFKKGDMILVEGRLQTRTYQDKDTGKNRKAFSIQANNVNFCGGRNNNGGTAQGAPSPDHSRPAASQETPAYSAGSADDFAIIDESADLPF